MTQSGQGEDPHLSSMRQAREGVVLPADGGGALAPGSSGDGATPAGGAPWGTPWGPDSAAPPPAPPAAPGAGWGQAPGAPEAPASGWDAAPEPPQSAPGAQHGAFPQPPAGFGQQPPGGVPLPPSAEPTPNAPGGHGALDGSGSFGADASAGSLGQGIPGGAPLSPNGAAGDEAATQYLPPIAADIPDVPGGPGAPGGPGGPHGPGGFGGPSELPADSTQRLGRVPQTPGPGGQAPHVGPPSHGGPGGLPRPAADDPDSQPTQFLDPVPASPEAPFYDGPPGAPRDGAGTGHDAPSGKQPPAEFESLFRNGPRSGEPHATQRLPRIQQPPQGVGRGPAPYASGSYQQGQQRGGYGYPPEGYTAGHVQIGPDRGNGRPPKRRGSGKAALIAAAGVGIVVLGVGAGALLGSKGDKGDKDPKSDGPPPSVVATTSPSPSEDPAKAQAVALDKLLADSNDSRAAVIRAVENVKVCKNLSQSATDLRNAAKQRNQLVTRLSKLSVDRLPNHDRLTTALTNAWRSSASADNHYAAWARQVSRKHGCHKGKARVTSQAAAGNKASGDATRAKGTAAELWNAIARQYGLTTRQTSQL